MAKFEKFVKESEREPYEYEPPDRLEIPDFPDKDQYVYRWLRVLKNGKDDDAENIVARLREGWEFVKLDAVKALMPHHISIPVKSSFDVLDGCIRVGDLALAKIERFKAEAYLRYIQKQSQQRMDLYTKPTIIDQESGTLIANESDFGSIRGRQPQFGD